jgi:hypothetical protein
MRKLNQNQVEKIKKDYGRLGAIIVQNVERYGNEKEALENDINFAYDIMLAHAE